MGTQVTYRGVVYASVSALARALGFDPSTFGVVVSGAKRSRTLEGSVLTYRLRVDRKGNGPDGAFVVDDRYYKRLLDLCKMRGWDYPEFVAFRFSAGQEERTVVEVAAAYKRGTSVCSKEVSELRLSKEKRYKKRHGQEILYSQIDWSSPCVSGGRSFDSLDDALRVNKVTRITFFNRINAGYSLEEACKDPVRKSGKRGGFTVNGVTYDSQREALASLGFARQFVARYRQDLPGLSFAEALGVLDDFFKRYGGNRPHWIEALPDVIYNAEWLSRADFARACGVGVKLLHVKTGGTRLPLEQMDTLKHKKVGKYMKARGKAVGSPLYPECTYQPTGYCVNIGSDFDVYLQEVRAARGLAEPPKKNYKSGVVKEVEYRGVRYPSLAQFCAAHGLDYVKFYAFGWGTRTRYASLEDTLEAFNKRNTRKGKSASVEYAGVVYPSVAALCRATGWDYRAGLAYKNKRRG